MNIGKQTPLQELENLTEDIRIHHAEYSTADWKEVYARYEQISAEMENYQYSPEEAKKIGKLEENTRGHPRVSNLQLTITNIHLSDIVA
jgi:hypothetical protein